MKKRIFIFLSIALIIFAACADSAGGAERISLPLRITANLKGNDAVFTLSVTETECTITFDESHALSGTELNFDSNGGTATVGDFTREVDMEMFPAQAALVKALRAVSVNPDSGTKTENGMKYAIDETVIMVYYDMDTEEIIGIGTEESERRFEFDIAELELYEIQSDSAD